MSHPCSNCGAWIYDKSQELCPECKSLVVVNIEKQKAENKSIPDFISSESENEIFQSEKVSQESIPGTL